MDFAGLYFNTDHKRMEVKGYTLRKDTADPYIMALLNSGKHRMKAHEILSGRTALYTNTVSYTHLDVYKRQMVVYMGTIMRNGYSMLQWNCVSLG